MLDRSSPGFLSRIFKQPSPAALQLARDGELVVETRAQLAGM